MSSTHDLVSVAAAAEELGITPDGVRGAIKRGLITPVRLDGRTNLIPRDQLDRYKAQHQGRRGRPPKTSKQPSTKRAEPKE
jgi:excisionase family DNA binding protein